MNISELKPIECTIWTKEIVIANDPMYFPYVSYTCVSSQNSNNYMKKCLDTFVVNPNQTYFADAFIVPTKIFKAVFKPLFTQIKELNAQIEKINPQKPTWILIDDDCYQWCMKNSENSYSFLMIMENNQGKYNVVLETINLDDYEEKECEEAVQFFDYETLNEVKEIYKDSWKQIVAECLFEDSALSADVIKTCIDFHQAMSFIDNYIKSNS